ncbi:hypothetical protein LCGC14_2800190, partial [marine sediment metagenome]
IEELIEEKGIERSILNSVICEGMLAAYKKKYPDLALQVETDKKTEEIKVTIEKEIVSSVQDETSQISLKKARYINKNLKKGDKVWIPFEGKIGRIEILRARQVIANKIRQIELLAIYNEFKDKEGEIVLGGPCIMKGYYKNPRATHAVIETDKKGVRWLYTGDLGTVDKDGYIYLTARKKEIIKVGGKRISPKEIEAVILELPQVVDCSIEAVEDDILGEALMVKIVVGSNEDSINEEIVRSHCAGKLALFKVPQKLEFMKQMSVSATGKKVKKLN